MAEFSSYASVVTFRYKSGLGYGRTLLNFETQQRVTVCDLQRKKIATL